MTDDDEIAVRIQADGLDNELKIRNVEDLQVAIEYLQLAARYQFDVDISEKVRDGFNEELIERVEKLDEKIEKGQMMVNKEVEITEEMRRFNSLVQDFLEEKDHIDVRRDQEKSVSSNKGGNGDSESSSSTDEDEESEDEDQDPEVESEEEEEEQDLSSKTIPEIVEEQLVDVESPPYSYDEFKDFSYTEQQAAIYAQLLLIQPATKEEVADALIKGEPGNTETQYVYQRLDDLTPHVDKRRRPSDSPRDPYEYAEEGFDSEDASDSGDESSDDAEEDVDDSLDQKTDEGIYGLEWKTIDVAVQEYRNDSSKKFLLCIRSMSSFTSPTMAENHAEEDEGEVWAASEELPDDFVK